MSSGDYVVKSVRGENGRILIFVLIIVLTLSVFWVIALSETGSELRIIGGKKSAAQQFFDAEAAVNLTIESLYNSTAGLYSGSPWYNSVVTLTPQDDSGNNLAQVTVRPIHDFSVVSGQPSQPHEFTPPAGSGSGVNTSVGKRFVISSVVGDTEIQVGVYRIVPR